MDNHPFLPALYPHGHHIASVSACRKRKTMEKEAVRSSCVEGTGNYSGVKIVVSPYFKHDYPPGTKIEIASKNNDNANFVSASTHNNSQGKEKEKGQKEEQHEKKSRVTSPYFQHNYPPGTKIEIGSKHTDNAKFVSASTHNNSQGKEKEEGQKEEQHEKKSRVTSPYFKHNYRPGTKIEIESKNIDNAKFVSASTHNNSQGKEKEEGQKEEQHEKKSRVTSPYFKHNYPPGTKIEIASKNTDNAKFVSASTHNNSQSKEKEKGQKEQQHEKKSWVVSPYFDNSNYSKENYNIVVKEKAKERTLHSHTSSSSSLFSTEREGEGHGRGRSINRFNSILEAYRRKRKNNYWTPPKSRYGLLQESYYQDPWKVLIICMLLNRTTGCQARQVISDLFTLCPDARTATKVETGEIEKIIRSLGLQKKRSIMIQRFSEEYLRDDWTHVLQLHGIGKYAADAYAIFCTGFWKDVQPVDHKLVQYWEDLWKSEIIGNRT